MEENIKLLLDLLREQRQDLAKLRKELDEAQVLVKDLRRWWTEEKETTHALREQINGFTAALDTEARR